MLSATHQEKLEALRRRLAERLPGIVSDIEASCRELLALPADPDRRERAVRGSHTLAGTAGTYGYLALGQAAKALELLLRGGGSAEAVEAQLGRLRLELP